MVVRRSTLKSKRKDDLIEDVLDANKELDALRKQVRAAEARPAAAVKEATTRALTVREAVADVSVESVVRNMTDIGLTTQRAFDNVQQQLTDATKQLDTVREANTLEERRLHDLHGIDVAATSLAQLIDNIDTRTATFEAEQAEAIEAFEADVEAREAESEEFTAALNQERAREQSDHVYKQRIERRRTEDAYTQQCQDADRERGLRIASEDRARNERLASIEAAEDELNSLRTQVGGFDALLASAVEAAKEEATNAANRSAGFKAAMAGKDAESKTALLEAQVATLTSQGIASTETVVSLQEQLVAANERNTSMATQALKSAEGQTALAELRSATSFGRDGATPKRN